MANNYRYLGYAEPYVTIVTNQESIKWQIKHNIYCNFVIVFFQLLQLNRLFGHLEKIFVMQHFKYITWGCR